jgi:hypothetical protein
MLILHKLWRAPDDAESCDEADIAAGVELMRMIVNPCFTIVSVAWKWLKWKQKLKAEVMKDAYRRRLDSDVLPVFKCVHQCIGRQQQRPSEWCMSITTRSNWYWLNFSQFFLEGI